jgi:hypothetical protein
MSKARLLLVLAASLVTVATTVGAQTAPPPDDDDDPQELDASDRQAIHQLRPIARQLVHQDERLAKVLTIVGPPEQPVPTEIRAELLKVKTGALAIVNRTAPYLGGTVAPTPPAATGPGTAAPPAAGPGTAEPVSPRVIRQLQSIGRRLVELDERLARVLTIVGPPEQPVPDEVKAEITNVRNAAQAIVGRVSPYLGNVVPPPPTDGGNAAP